MRQFVILTAAGPACNLLVTGCERWLPPLKARGLEALLNHSPWKMSQRRVLLPGGKDEAYWHFFLMAALRWNTSLGLPDAWAVNKTAAFTPSTAAQNTGWLSESSTAFSCGKQTTSPGSTESRPYTLCCGSLWFSSLTRSCPEWPIWSGCQGSSRLRDKHSQVSRTQPPLLALWHQVTAI